MTVPIIQAGDVLGYHGHGLFSSLIRLKTWAPALVAPWQFALSTELDEVWRRQ